MLSPLGSIQQLVAAYREHERMSRVLEGCGDTIIGAYFRRAIIRARPEEAKQEALNSSGIVLIHGFMHDIADSCSLWNFAGKERFRIGGMYWHTCLNSGACRDQCLYKQRQFALVASRFLVR